jgi:hypothetical protein
MTNNNKFGKLASAKHLIQNKGLQCVGALAIFHAEGLQKLKGKRKLTNNGKVVENKRRNSGCTLLFYCFYFPFFAARGHQPQNLFTLYKKRKPKSVVNGVYQAISVKFVLPLEEKDGIGELFGGIFDRLSAIKPTSGQSSLFGTHLSDLFLGGSSKVRARNRSITKVLRRNCNIA